MQQSIAVLYICTGNYSHFWDEFYSSSEKFFLPGFNKHYFVWTDDTHIQSNKKITVIRQEKMGRPYDTLYRFRLFLSMKDTLKKFDYIVFFNANTKFIRHITSEEFLPHDEEKFIGLLHFTYINKSNTIFPYERNSLSKAYIPIGKGKHYYLGSLNGGKTKEYLEMCEWCNNAIIEDEKNDIIPLWHDESMLNKFFLNRNDIKVLDPTYGFVESLLNIKWSPKIICLEKTYYMGHKDGMRSNQKLKINILNYIKVKSIFYIRGFVRHILDITTRGKKQ